MTLLFRKIQSDHQNYVPAVRNFIREVIDLTATRGTDLPTADDFQAAFQLAHEKHGGTISSVTIRHIGERMWEELDNKIKTKEIGGLPARNDQTT